MLDKHFPGPPGIYKVYYYHHRVCFENVSSYHYLLAIEG